MTLLIEVAGVLVLAAGIELLFERGGMRPTVAAVAVIAVAALGLAFWANVWSESRTLITNHQSSAKLTIEQRNTLAGGLFPANESFLAFAASQIPKGARVFVDCGHQSYAPCGSQIEWVSFRLQPRVSVSSPSQAQWYLFYGADPAHEPFAHDARVITFGPSLALARAR